MEIEMFWLCIELSTYQHFHVFIANCVHKHTSHRRETAKTLNTASQYRLSAAE